MTQTHTPNYPAFGFPKVQCSSKFAQVPTEYIDKYVGIECHSIHSVILCSCYYVFLT